VTILDGIAGFDRADSSVGPAISTLLLSDGVAVALVAPVQVGSVKVHELRLGVVLFLDYNWAIDVLTLILDAVHRIPLVLVKV